MLNKEYEEAMGRIRTSDPKLYSILHNHAIDLTKEISNASHTICNMISFINCSYQYITDVYPETENFEYWPDISSSLSKLIEYTSRTSSYRYSFNEPEISLTNLIELLQNLPSSLENMEENPDFSEHDVRNRQWIYNLDSPIKEIHTDRYQLKAALLELVKNGLESCPASLPITIASKQINKNTCALSISYESNDIEILQSHSQAELQSPFFTTKEDHAGLGLSIVNNICQKLHGHFFLSTSGSVVINTIELSI